MRKEAKTAEKIFLATDPDREGEAISWHIAHLLGIDEKSACRVVFNEITKGTIQNAVKNPRVIDKKLVDAQQARRVLDRLVGYQISPLLWRKIRRGLSAGRVQSAALKIICDREKAILDFVPKEYWTITALLEKMGERSKRSKKKQVSAKLVERDGKKITVDNKKLADEILAGFKKNDYIVKQVEEKERVKKPLPPFTTSTLQQEGIEQTDFSQRKRC